MGSRRRKLLLKKNCVVCGKAFETCMLIKIYCSKECRIFSSNERARKRKGFVLIEEKRKCKFCKNEFIWSSSRPKVKFCTRECCKQFYTEKYREQSKGIINQGNGESFNYLRLRFEIFKRDNFTCQYCGRNVKEDKIKLHCDHIHPNNKGGLFVANNLITSCEECNLGKKDVLLEKRALRETC